jgi:carbon-monoxide dehydrogenase medium subunit
MILRPFEYVECADVADAVSALVRHGDDARLIAGGTAVVPLMKHGILRPAVLVSVARVPGLGAIESLADGGVRVGALATHAAVARSPLVRERVPLLAEACGRVASPTIRAMGTLGGNLCYGESASDPSPALLALRAHVRLTGREGERVVPIGAFFTGFYETVLRDGEVLTAIDVPPVPGALEAVAGPPDVRWRYLKWTPRAREDKALVGLAAVLSVHAGVCRLARLGLGGVAASPVALTGAEAVLEGARLDARVVERAADAAASEVEPIEDLQGTAEYRRDMLRVWTRRVLAELATSPAAAPRQPRRGLA